MERSLSIFLTSIFLGLVRSLSPIRHRLLHLLRSVRHEFSSIRAYRLDGLGHSRHFFLMSIRAFLRESGFLTPRAGDERKGKSLAVLPAPLAMGGLVFIGSAFTMRRHHLRGLEESAFRRPSLRKNSTRPR